MSNEKITPIPVIRLETEDDAVLVDHIIKGIKDRELMALDAIKKLFKIYTEDGEVSGFDVTSALYKRAGAEESALTALFIDKNRLGTIAEFVFTGHQERIIISVVKFLSDDFNKLQTICLRMTIKSLDNSKVLVNDTALVAYNTREISADDEPIMFEDEEEEDEGTPIDPDADEQTTSAEEEHPAEAKVADEAPAAESPAQERQPSADINDRNVQDGLMRGLFGTTMPAITHIMRYLHDFHEKNKTPSYLASMETVPTETTIVFTDPPYDFTISIMKMKEGRFYRMHLAHTDLSLPHHEFSRTRNIEGRWVQFGRDIQNTTLNQPQQFNNGGYRRRY